MSLIDDPLGCHGRISLEVNDRTIWNKNEFLKFLIDHQGLVIDIEIPEGACLKTLGLYDLLDSFSFKAVTIRTHNLVECAPDPYQLNIHHQASFQYFHVPFGADYSRYHHWTGNKVFGALYNQPSWHRIGLTGHLLKNHQQSTAMNFRYDPSDIDARTSFELEKLFQVDPVSVKNFASVVDQLPMRLGDTDSYTVGATTQEHTDQLSKFYPDFLIDIVAETFVRGRSFYPTEKTIRPMLMKKPFIHMGPKCFLTHLHQMGFRTFFEYWDETYDGFTPEEKYIKILKLINFISRKSPEELQKMYTSMQPILDHNYKLLVTNSFTKKIDYVE